MHILHSLFLPKGNLHVEYDAKTAYNGKIIKENLLQYIRKHDAEFSLDEDIERYQHYYGIAQRGVSDPTKAYIEILITWGNNNILYNRLQSIHNMMQFCYEKNSEEAFKKRLADYIRYTEQIVFLIPLSKDHGNMKIGFKS